MFFRWLDSEGPMVMLFTDETNFSHNDPAWDRIIPQLMRPAWRIDAYCRQFGEYGGQHGRRLGRRRLNLTFFSNAAAAIGLNREKEPCRIFGEKLGKFIAPFCDNYATRL